MEASLISTVLLISFVTFNNGNIAPTEAATRMEASAPINPVDLHGVFAIHCHVWDLDPDAHEVSIYRTLDSTGKYQRLTLGDHVQPGVSDGIFLAVRHLSDSSKVFFMTIADVSIRDEGRYTCMVSGVPGNEAVDEGSIDLKVVYFPSDTSPTCVPPESPVLEEGITSQFNCSSEIGNPLVSIGWKLTGSNTFLDSKEVIVGKTIYSILKFTPRLEDNTAVLLCEISSNHFPKSQGYRTCHIGPITVTRNPNINRDETFYHPTRPVTTVPVISNMGSPPMVTHKFNTTLDCSATCSKLNTPVSYWITATAFLSVVAFVFFVIAVILSVKYCNAKDETDYIGPYATRHIQHIPQLPPDLRDKVYVEVEHKRDNGRMYMSLQRPINNNPFPK